MGRQALFLTLLLTTSVAVGAEVRTSPGQPICTVKDELQEYLLAAIQHDEKWMKELSSCAAIVGGAKVAIIEEYPSDSDIGHVVKVRVFSPQGRGSIVGYTLSIGLEGKK